MVQCREHYRIAWLVAEVALEASEVDCCQFLVRPHQQRQQCPVGAGRHVDHDPFRVQHARCERREVVYLVPAEPIRGVGHGEQVARDRLLPRLGWRRGMQVAVIKLAVPLFRKGRLSHQRPFRGIR